VNADIRVSNAVLDLYLRSGRCGEGELRVNSMHLRRDCTDERKRNRVPSRIAARQVSSPIVRMRRLRVLVSGKPVMVLRMIVIGVGVGVQQGHHAGSRNQRRDEQQRQDAVHELSL
jgi:hypothetical protein